MALLAKRIEDTQFLDLIRDMLNAGYVEEWQYHRTYSGTPQGGIVSPILANIYLHEFDESIPLLIYGPKYESWRESGMPRNMR